jgi:hypothetical protein
MVEVKEGTGREKEHEMKYEVDTERIEALAIKAPEDMTKGELVEMLDVQNHGFKQLHAFTTGCCKILNDVMETHIGEGLRPDIRQRCLLAIASYEVIEGSGRVEFIKSDGTKIEPEPM